LAVVVNDKSARRALGLLLVGAACIALTPVFVRVSEVGPLPTAFWRAALALPCLTAAIPFLPREAGQAIRPSRWLHLGVFALGGLLFAGDLSAYNASVDLTSVANATLFANTAPLFVAVYSFALFRTRFTRQFLAGMAAALAGVLLLLYKSLGVGQQHILGDILGLATGMFYAGYMLAIARLRSDMAAPSALLLTLVFTALFLAPITWIGGGAWLAHSLSGWLALVGLALVSQSVGQGLIAYAFAYLPPAFGAVSLLLQPVLAAVFAWVLFGEVLGPVEMGGIAVVLAGVLIARQGALRHG
jgi:drug/metabolite transporter (DMT)-like permease